MKMIAVVTATRAEYGLLMPVIKALRGYESAGMRVELIVTGTHLDPGYGFTVQEIEADGLRIDERIPIPVASGSAVDISNNQAETLKQFALLFEKKQYDAILLLGDRYEILAVAVAAGNSGTPIFHLAGGDTTEGAVDEWVRHSVTKMAYLHFVTNEGSRRRVLQMGEDRGRVFNYGSTSMDNIMRLATLSKEEALGSIGLPLCDYALCTYHPVTMGQGGTVGKIKDFLDAIKCFPGIEFIATKSNADLGGANINALLEEAGGKIKNLHVFASLGAARYLSLMRHAEFVLGNSSSGIIEAPAFRIPTINIGDRQRGRLQAGSILNCGETKEAIVEAVSQARTEAFRAHCKDVGSPYGEGDASVRIAEKVFETVGKGKIDLKKKFCDIHFEVE